VKILRVNTNGSRVLPNLDAILERGVHVVITLSLDGTGLVHDYVRWPIKWTNYIHSVDAYTRLRQQYRNLTVQAWTVLHALNAGDYDNIVEFTQANGIKHSWALLENPTPLDPKRVNDLTIAAKKSLKSTYPDIAKVIASEENNQQELDQFLQQQDRLRNISFGDYFL
jgi:sulfatase maturation enzyme AslB (radical SAM superfamily)